MRMLVFARRNAREILRDPLTAIFSLGFPVVILALLTAIQANVPVDLFRLETLTPGVTIFGLAFMTLFSATLIARDRETALLQRLYTTPLTAADFIFGYLLPGRAHCAGAMYRLLRVRHAVRAETYGYDDLGCADGAARRFFLHWAGAFVRQHHEYQASRRPVRRAADQSDGVAVRHVVRPEVGGRCF